MGNSLESSKSDTEPGQSKGKLSWSLPFKDNGRASVVVQWLGIHLPMQETQVQSLDLGRSHVHGATKSVHHNH